MAEHFVHESELPVSAAEAFAWHTRPGALERLSPPWAPPVIVHREGDLRGGRVELRVPTPVGGARWVAEHDGYEEGVSFRDRQIEGPFAEWVHTHRFVPRGTDRCLLVDDIQWALPLGGLGRLVAGGTVRDDLLRTFTFRHARTRHDLVRQRELGGSPLRVAVSGASGLVGRALVAFLGTGGHEVLSLVRRPARTPHEVQWDPAAGTVDRARLEGLDAIVHLAGENVGERWTDARKRAIVDSRVLGTRALADAILALDAPPRAFVSASAVGFYGDRGDELLDEGSAGGSGFLAETCRAWEDEARRAEPRTRVVRARIGVVLTALGGALGKMLPPFRKGVGGVVGDGRQFVPWISLDDLVAALVTAVRVESLEGPVNVVADAVPNAALTRTLGRALGRPTFVPVPAAMIKALFGEMGREVLLGGQRVAPRRLREVGFRFEHPDLASLLAFELGAVPRPAEGLPAHP